MATLTAAQISQANWTPSSDFRHFRLIQPESFMESMVISLRGDDTPLFVKISILALPILIGHLLGTLMGNLLLTIPIVVLPVTIYALFAWHQLNIRESFVLDTAARFHDVKEALGGEEAFNRIPELRTAHYIGFLGISPPIEADQMEHSVMRGTDTADRPFICLKVCSHVDDEPSVNILYQQYANAGRWLSTYSVLDNFSEALAEIRSLVVDQNHPQLRLA